MDDSTNRRGWDFGRLWPFAEKTDLPTHYILALSGHIGAGKTAFTNHLLTAFAQLPQDAQFFRNPKSRLPLPSEVDGVDFDYVPKEKWEEKVGNGEIVAPYARPGGVNYGFSPRLIEAAKSGSLHTIANLNFDGIHELRKYLGENKISTPLVSIGIYTDFDEARRRMISREHLTEDQLRAVTDQLANLPVEFDRYRRHTEFFDFLFYNPNDSMGGSESLDHLVHRTLDLMRFKNGTDSTGSAFSQDYVNRQIVALFGSDLGTLDGRLKSGEQVEVAFSSEDIRRYIGINGPESEQHLHEMSRRKVSGITNAYGILTVSFDETDFSVESNDIQIERRKIFQDFLKIRLGVPQEENQTGIVGQENVSRRSLLYSPNCRLSFISSFTPRDLFPLVHSDGLQHLPNYSEKPSILSFEGVYRQNGVATVLPMEKKEIPKYVPSK